MQRALVEMKEREKILTGKKKRALAARTVYVSLNTADAFIEGGLVLRGRHIWRRKIRMIFQILLPGLVAKHDPESPVRIHIGRFLHIQFVVWNHVLGGFFFIFLHPPTIHLHIPQPETV